MNKKPARDLQPGMIIVAPWAEVTNTHMGLPVTLVKKWQPIRQTGSGYYNIWDATDEWGDPCRVYINQAGSVDVVSDPAASVQA
jgi:hypothetical protein